MKKSIAIIIVLALLVGAGIAYYIAVKPNSNTANTVASSTATSVTACDILTATVAKEILGSNVTQPSGAAGDASTPDITVSNCSYITPASTTTSIPKTSGVNVLVRTAKTQEGIESNKNQFTTLPSGAQIVDGIGDKAFYNPTFRQLNVLKGGNWYIVTYYVDSLANATLDTDKKLAQKLQFQ